MAILECLKSDNQLSVRYLMEWVVVVLLSAHNSLWKELLLPQLEKVPPIFDSVRTYYARLS